MSWQRYEVVNLATSSEVDEYLHEKVKTNRFFELTIRKLKYTPDGSYATDEKGEKLTVKGLIQSVIYTDNQHTYLFDDACLVGVGFSEKQIQVFGRIYVSRGNLADTPARVTVVIT